MRRRRLSARPAPTSGIAAGSAAPARRRLPPTTVRPVARAAPRGHLHGKVGEQRLRLFRQGARGARTAPQRESDPAAAAAEVSPGRTAVSARRSGTTVVCSERLGAGGTAARGVAIHGRVRRRFDARLAHFSRAQNAFSTPLRRPREHAFDAARRTIVPPSPLRWPSDLRWNSTGRTDRCTRHGISTRSLQAAWRSPRSPPRLSSMPATPVPRPTIRTGRSGSSPSMRRAGHPTSSRG